MNFRSVWNIFAVVIVLFVIGTPLAMAQDATEEAPAGDVVVVAVEESALVNDVSNTLRESVTNVVVVVVGAIGAIVVILAGVFAVVIGKLGGHLYQSVPSYYRDALNQFLDKFTLQLQDVSKNVSTPFEFDDVFTAKLREQVMLLITPVVQAELIKASNALVEKARAQAGGE